MAAHTHEDPEHPEAPARRRRDRRVRIRRARALAVGATIALAGLVVGPLAGTATAASVAATGLSAPTAAPGDDFDRPLDPSVRGGLEPERLAGEPLLEGPSALVPGRLAVAGLGDSITRAFGANGYLAYQPWNSWSTGDSAAVGSHAQRLRAAGHQVSAWNGALSGSTASDLVRQARLVSWVQPDYVTILTGANDVCGAADAASLPDPATYEARVRAAVDVLVAANPDVEILLVSVPDIVQLREVGKKDLGVRLRWAITGLCRIALGDPLSTRPDVVARVAAVDENVRALNARLEVIAAEHDAVWSDGGAVHATPFEPRDISTLDGFHPSLSGQAKIAAVSWDAAVAQGLLDELG